MRARPRGARRWPWRLPALRRPSKGLSVCLGVRKDRRRPQKSAMAVESAVGCGAESAMLRRRAATPRGARSRRRPSGRRQRPEPTLGPLGAAVAEPCSNECRPAQAWPLAAVGAQGRGATPVSAAAQRQSPGTPRECRAVCDASGQVCDVI